MSIQSVSMVCDICKCEEEVVMNHILLKGVHITIEGKGGSRQSDICAVCLEEKLFQIEADGPIPVIKGIRKDTLIISGDK